jgi:hypothetical protein
MGNKNIYCWEYVRFLKASGGEVGLDPKNIVKSKIT